MTRTVGSVLREATRVLKSSEVTSAALDARLLLAFCLGCDQAALIRDRDRMLDTAVIGGFLALIERRRAREPVSRILGWREFHGRDFALGAATLDPRPDSETLIAASLATVAEEEARRRRILDLGTGTGALLITLLAELPEAVGVGVDIDPAALVVARQNARTHGVSGRACFVAGDWANALGGRFDLVVANPPYIRHDDIEGLEPEVRDHDPRRALDGGADGLAGHRAVAAAAARLLVPGRGVVAVEIGASQRSDVERLFVEAGMTILVGSVRRHDLAGRDRVVTARMGDAAATRKSLERADEPSNVRSPSTFGEGRTIAGPEWGRWAASWGYIRRTHDVSRIVFDRSVISAE